MGRFSSFFGCVAIGALIGYFIVKMNWDPEEAPDVGLRNGALIGGVIGGLIGAFGAGKATRD